MFNVPVSEHLQAVAANALVWGWGNVWMGAAAGILLAGLSMLTTPLEGAGERFCSRAITSRRRRSPRGRDARCYAAAPTTPASGGATAPRARRARIVTHLFGWPRRPKSAQVLPPYSYSRGQRPR